VPDKMQGRAVSLILVSVLVTFTVAAPTSPDAIVAEESPTEKVVPENLLGVDAKAKNILDPSTWFDGDYSYGYGSDESPPDLTACRDELEYQIDKKIDEQLHNVPKLFRSTAKSQIKSHVVKEMESHGQKTSCSEYKDAGECTQPQVIAACQKTCDMCGPPTAGGSGSGLPAEIPMPSTHDMEHMAHDVVSAAGSADTPALFQELAVDGQLYNEKR